MILCLDAGNTRLKWGLYDPVSGWQASGALPLSRLDDLTLPGADMAVYANVAGGEVEAWLERALEGLPVQRVLSRTAQCGVRNGYDKPEQLGADRWAALIGARALHPGPALVVMAGTATTVDLLGADGVFRGGLILPGLDLMRASLAKNTAQLDLLPGEFRELPTNTADAILSGCLQAQAGAVERLFQRIAHEPDALCLLGGGAASRLLPLLRIPVRPVENLVLEGLARIGQEAVGYDPSRL
ncbi:MAG: type III pantothenate kinase [Rhodocyclaceae bacterium]|nr:type III pantothenate kinase [Rhodocyclaceae bacterium]